MKSMMLAAAAIVALSFGSANAGEGGPNYVEAQAPSSVAQQATVQHASVNWTQHNSDGGFGNG